MREITSIVIHCSASQNGDASVTMEKIDGWHRLRGWRKIGYHYVIEIDGIARVGRGIEEIGAHVIGSNEHSVGICMVGTDRFTLHQWDALKALVTSLRLDFPQAVVLGHRDYSPDQDGDGVIEPWEWIKICPGFDVAAWLAAGMAPDWSRAHLYEPQAIA